MTSRLQDLARSPLSIKFLVLTYVITLAQKLPLLFHSEGSTLISLFGTFVVVAVSVTLLILIYLRISWAWIAGLADCLYWTLYCAYSFHRGLEPTSILGVDSLLSDPNLQVELAPEQLEMISALNSYGSVTFILIGALGTAWMWYATRNYFESSRRH